MENPSPKTAGYQVLSYLYFRYLKCLVNSGGKIPDSEEPLKNRWEPVLELNVFLFR